MKIKKSQEEAVSLFDQIAGQLAMMLPTKTRPFFISLVLGVIVQKIWPTKKPPNRTAKTGVFDQGEFLTKKSFREQIHLLTVPFEIHT